MKRDQIISIALQAKMKANLGYTEGKKHFPAVNAMGNSVPVEWLESFANLVEVRINESLHSLKLTDETIHTLWENYNPLNGIESFARSIEAEIHKNLLSRSQ